jgi:hypothetical protein
VLRFLGSGYRLWYKSTASERGKLRAGLGAEPLSRGFRAAHSGAAPSTGSAAVQQGPPRERLGQGGHFAKHDLDDVPDRVGGILGSSGTFQATINEQLQQIEGEHPKQQHGRQSIVRVAENMVQIPVANKLVEPRILEVPAGPADLQACAAGHPAGPLANERARDFIALYLAGKLLLSSLWSLPTLVTS